MARPGAGQVFAAYANNKGAVTAVMKVEFNCLHKVEEHVSPNKSSPVRTEPSDRDGAVLRWSRGMPSAGDVIVR